jgi:hypothetical protein
MTISTESPNRRRLLATSAAGVWIAAGLGYLILEATAAAGFRHHYSYAHNFISDLGVTSGGMSPLAYLMNAAFYLQGGASPSSWRLTLAADTVMRRGWFLLAVIRFTRMPDPPNSPGSICDVISPLAPVKRSKVGLTASPSRRSNVGGQASDRTPASLRAIPLHAGLVTTIAGTASSSTVMVTGYFCGAMRRCCR